MVSWTAISEAIAANTDKSYSVHSIDLKDGSVEIEKFPIVGKAKESIKPVVLPVVLAEPVRAQEPVRAPEPVRAKSEPSERRLQEPRTTKQLVDPIVLGIDARDPLYDGAPHHTRHQLETEEAALMESLLNDLYKSQGGRSRGWTKTGLETMIKPRCASGGNSRELDRVKAAFPWQLVGSDKACSAFLDFLCVAKKIRVAVWETEAKRIMLFPAADYVGVDVVSTFPLYHVTNKGEVRHGLRTCEDLVKFCDRDGWTLMPPLSIAHSLSGLTLAELESVGKKLGMAAVEGNKAERVAAVAVYKLRQRLLANSRDKLEWPMPN